MRSEYQGSTVPFWEVLEQFGNAAALQYGTAPVSYKTLAVLADEFVANARTKLNNNVERPLVLIEAGHTTKAIAAYLGALRAGWPVILAEHGAAAKTKRLEKTYRPNIVVGFVDGTFEMRATDHGAVDMASELAVMLSTSGSTGSEKLVRLSQENIASNAAAIAEYLELQADDCAITALPWHYSFGMSVIHAQLAVGGSTALTDHSLTDQAFWDEAQAAGVTVLPLVPMQFDILARRTRLKDDLPSLRRILQAGGKLDRSVAERFSERSKSENFALFLMYGQTEAAPRMSYLPPDAPRRALDTIGQAIPGGELRILDDEGAEITTPGVDGELTYRGPNVMMGYADRPEDLAKTGHLSELKTGDIAQRTKDGFFKIVGRTKRFIKLNGLRISLDQVESNLREQGILARVTGSDLRLDVFVTEKDVLVGLKERLCRDLKLGFGQVSTQCISEFPQLSSGKVDYRSLQLRADELSKKNPAVANELTDTLVAALRTNELDMNASFRDHGGDSLGYLEVELALSQQGVAVPENWETLPLKSLLSLEPASETAKPRWQPVSADLIWRIAAIIAVVAAHSTSWKTAGGAYFLLVLSGYSMARFQAPTLITGQVRRSVFNALLRILLWYYLVVLLIQAVEGSVPLRWWTLFGNFPTEGEFHKVQWFWYVSSMVQVTLLFSAPFLIKPVATWIGRNPFFYGLCLLVASIFSISFLQYQVGLEWHEWRHWAGAMQLAAIGWCAYYAERPVHKHSIMVSIVLILLFQWGVGYLTIQAFIALGAISLVYGLHIKLPARMARMLAYAGALTLPVYMLHAFAIAFVQRVGIAYADPNWPNWLMFGSTIILSVGIAAIALAVEKRALIIFDYLQDRVRPISKSLAPTTTRRS